MARIPRHRPPMDDIPHRDFLESFGRFLAWQKAKGHIGMHGVVAFTKKVCMTLKQEDLVRNAFNDETRNYVDL